MVNTIEIAKCGTTAHYTDGKLHRLDGPAIVWENGDESFFINGEFYTEKEFKRV